MLKRSIQDLSPEQMRERIAELESRLERHERSQRFVDTVLESIPSMIFVKDAQELRFTYMNRSGERLLGYRRQELLGKNDFDFFPQAQAEYFTAKDQAVFEKRETLEIPEEPVQARDGTLKILRTWKVPVFDEHGDPLYLLGISEDITERRRAEHERDKLRTQGQKVMDFVSAVSHDLRAPLTAAKASAELIRRFPERRDMLPKLTNAVIDNLQRADGMIRDLLDANRIQAGQRLQLRVSDVDLVGLAKTVATEFSLIYPNPFQVQGPESLHGLWDADALRRALENLCSNASKYGKNNASVTIKVISLGHSAQLCVHNHGSYIPKEQQAKLFERYFRWDESNPECRRGWGLGLLIVKAVAESHGGRVMVESSLESGTTFTIEIPRGAQS